MLATRELKAKRSVLVTLLQLFDAFLELETAAKKSLSTFEAYVEGEKVLLNIGIRDRLEEVFKALQSFSAHIHGVESKLAIYEPTLLFELQRSGWEKTSIVSTIDLLREMAPSQVKVNGKLTPLISYPVAIPELSRLRGRDYPLQAEELNRSLEVLRNKILEKFDKNVVDLRIPEDARAALQLARDNIRSMEGARAHLAAFIRENLPLASLLAMEE